MTRQGGANERPGDRPSRPGLFVFLTIRLADSGPPSVSPSSNPPAPALPGVVLSRLPYPTLWRDNVYPENLTFLRTQTDGLIPAMFWQWPHTWVDRQYAIGLARSVVPTLPEDDEVRVGLLDQPWNVFPKFALVLAPSINLSRGEVFAVSTMSVYDLIPERR
jgi:hypothetical protein